jgi:DNA ligase-1
MRLPTLYIKRETGALQTWTIEVEGNRLRTITGVVDGKLVTSNWSECEGKNVGRSNETSPEAQAMSEAQSKWQHRIDKGYKEDPNEIGDSAYFKPMLAKKFTDYADELKYPVYCQPKLDGIRAVCTKDGIFSRNGKPLVTLNFIHESLKPLFNKYPNLVVDGEGYADKFSNDFNKIVSLIKKTKPTEEDIEEAKEHIRYHVYDCYKGDDEIFSARSKFIRAELDGNTYVSLVPTYRIDTRVQLDDMYGKFLDAGYEGQMIRLDAKYDNKRTASLLKRKEFQDAEYKILTVEEGEGNRAGTVGYMTFETAEGKPFKSNVKGNFEYLRKLLADKGKLPGKYATIKFFSLSKDNVPRFPFVIAIRDYE